MSTEYVKKHVDGKRIQVQKTLASTLAPLSRTVKIFILIEESQCSLWFYNACK